MVFGDANVDITVDWPVVNKALGKLPQRLRNMIRKAVVSSKKSKFDIEYYLPKQDPLLSKFFSSLKPRVELGGCGAIKALIMASLGRKVIFYSWVGADKNGKMILARLSGAGVDVSHVLVEGRTCETYNIRNPGHKRVAFSYWTSKLDFSKFITAIKRRKPDAVLLAGAHRVKKPLGYAKLPGAYVFTGSFAQYSKKKLKDKYLKDLSSGILMANDSEIMQLSDAVGPAKHVKVPIRKARSAVSGMRMLGNYLIVMHGPHYTAVKRGHEVVISRTPPLKRHKVVELTGIGDVWEAVFISEVGDIRRASHQRLREAMLAASNAAISRMSGRTVYLNRDS